MAMKVNYGFERAERNRAKQAKRDAKAKAKGDRDADGFSTGDEPEGSVAAVSGAPVKEQSNPD
jgi:hypothetical protein